MLYTYMYISPREGNSGLGNTADCIVHGVAKSQTRLSAFHLSLTHSHTHTHTHRCGKNFCSLIFGIKSSNSGFWKKCVDSSYLCLITWLISWFSNWKFHRVFIRSENTHRWKHRIHMHTHIYTQDTKCDQGQF